MEVNNNAEINKMFNPEDEASLPPEETEPDLQTSPLGDDASPGDSPFQKEISFDADEADSVSNDDDSQKTVIGDHQSFGFSGGYSRRISLKLAAILLPVVLILGVVGGMLGCYVYYFGFNVSSEQSAALNALENVHDYVYKRGGLDRIVFTDVYVKNMSNKYDCLVFSVIETEPVVFQETAFHVIIYKDSDKVDVFIEFDEEEYMRLKESGDEKDEIEAEFMLSREHDFERILDEVRGGDKKWVNVDPTFLNAKINKLTIKG